MSKQEVREVLRELLGEHESFSSQLQHARSLLSSVRHASDSLTKLNEVAELRIKVAAYEYATTYRLQQDVIDHIQMRFTEGVRCLRLDINPYDLVLRSEQLVDVIQKNQKRAAKRKSQVEKLTIDEIDERIASLTFARDAVTKNIALLEKIRPQKVEEYEAGEVGE